MKKIELEDFSNYQYLSEIKLTEDGKRCLFVVSQADLDHNSYQHHIWMADLINNKVMQCSGGGKERGIILESADTILFPADRDGLVKKANAEHQECSAYYRLNLNGGEAVLAFTLPLAVTSLKLIDEQYAVAIANVDLNKPDLSALSGDELKQTIQALNEEKDYEVLDELPYWFNNQGFINKHRKQAFLVNLQTGEHSLLSPILMNVNEMALSEDKKTLILCGSEYQDIRQPYSVILKVNLDTKETEPLLADNQYNVSHIALSKDCLIFTGTDLKTWGTNENDKFFACDLHTKELTCFFDPDWGIGSSVGSDAKLYGGTSFKYINDKLYFIATVDNASNLYELTLDGECKALTQQEGSVDCFDIVDETVVFIGMRNMLLQEVYQLKQNQEIRLSDINTAALADTYVAKPEKLSFINEDQERVDGWVLKPYNYDPNKKYPAILDIHGGPKVVYGETFFHEMQAWASQGYFVFFANPHGSDGRGNRFMHMVNRYGTIDYNDLMTFTDEVLKQYPAIDHQHIAVTGGSYGGFMTNWIIGHTNRFCCAGSQRSIANWISKSLTTDIGYYHNMTQMAATPWQNVSKMWDFSPLKYADQCVTPTLFIQSDEDYRCWMCDAMQMFHALKLHHVETRMCLFKGENHELSRSGKPKHRLRRLKELTHWFDRYCK